MTNSSKIQGRESPLNPTPAAGEIVLSADALARGEELRSAMEDAVGASFCLVVRGASGWRKIAPTTKTAEQAEPLAPDLAEAIERIFSAGGPVIALLDGRDESLVIAPLSISPRIRCGVVGVSKIQGNALAQRLLSAVSRTGGDHAQLSRMEQELQNFAQQVTTDFEELTWLRALTSHIELCKVDHDINEVAAAILPVLCELTWAEAVVLLPVASESPQPSAARCYYRNGHSELSLEQCAMLAEMFGPATAEHPFVRNTGFGWNSELDELRNVILARVGQGKHQYGWLLVLNKIVNPADEGVGGGDARTYCATEFGTFEAGMVSAAAVLLGSHARNVTMFREQEALYRGVVKALVDALDAKDNYTCGHSDRVAQMARRLAAEMGLSPEDCEQLYMAGVLHDIGKIGVPDDVLKKPGKLTAEEFELIKKHPTIGHSILQHIPQLAYVLPGVLYHHEAVDGRGYPEKLSGESIPLFGRLLAVVDAFDAMTSDRPYRKGMPADRAEQILREGAGKQWDARAVAAFFRARDEMYAICGIESPDAVPARITGGDSATVANVMTPGFGLNATATPASVNGG